MRKKRLKSLTAMVVLGAIFATSCTSDEFYGIEENYEGIGYPMLEKIANSKEYIVFKKQEILCMQDLSKIDTTQMELIDTIGGRPHYVIKKTIRPAIEARHKLVALYPEYEKTTPEERFYILNIAMKSDRSLNDMVKKNIPNTILSTKSANYESDAVRWIRSASQYELISDSYGCTDLVTGANSMWLVNGITMYAYDDYLNPWYDAISLSIRYQVEYGGFSWQDSDGSGILVEDSYAIIGNMHVTNLNGEPSPSYDFHVHPGGSFHPSPADSTAWFKMSWHEHYILNQEGDSWLHIL